jgi:peptidoglycan/LPS O-acetylase OafA/YrhL
MMINCTILGVVNSILSWGMFMPLSRLCYAAFLVQMNFIKVYNVNQGNSLYFNQGQMTIVSVGILNVVFLLSFLLSLTVELPFINLEQLVLANRPKIVSDPTTAATDQHGTEK